MSRAWFRDFANRGRQAAPAYNMTIPVNVVLTPTGSTGVAVFETAVVGDFPEGNILLLGAVARLGFAGPGGSADLSDTWAGDYSLGSAPTADATLSGTEVDIIPSTAIGPATAEVIAPVRATNATQVVLDNTDGSLEINLNVLFDADVVTNAETVNVTVTGFLHLAYIVLGDD